MNRMQPMTIPEIVSAVGGTWLNPREGAAPVTAVSTDSRRIAPGCLFLPLTGEKFDGHDFLDKALSAGAAGCLCAKVPETLRADKFYIRVEDTRLALRALASAYRDRFQIPFVQITGSVGKTTTKEMVASVLGASLRVLKTPENFNNDIGTPLTLLGLGPEHQAAVIETGMNHFGEIRYLGEMVRPDIAVISNIGDAHIEHLGSREGILKAKCEIFENLKPEGLAVLNGDDALLNTLDLPFRTVRCGQSEHCAVRVTEVTDHGVDGITCTIVSPRDTYHLSIPAPGEHMAWSAAMAVAVAEELGVERDAIVRGAAAYEPAGSRMRVVRLPGDRLVLDDCYNANPTVRHRRAGGAGQDRVRPEGGRAGRYGRAGGADGPGPLQHGRPGGHAWHRRGGRHRYQGGEDRRRRRPERRLRHPFRHQGGGCPHPDRPAGPRHRYAGEGVPQHALRLACGAAQARL